MNGFIFDRIDVSGCGAKYPPVRPFRLYLTSENKASGRETSPPLAGYVQQAPVSLQLARRSLAQWDTADLHRKGRSEVF